MFRTISKVLLLALLAASAACSHSHYFNQSPNVSKMERHKLAGRRIYLDLNDVPEMYSARAGGHTYTMTGIRSSNDELLRRLFGTENLVSDPSKADVTLKVSVQLNLSAGMLGTKCNSNAQVTIASAEKALAEGAGQGESHIPTTAVGGQNCEIATLQAVPAALDQAMNQL